ncbi:MAG TPA: D-cysteine desulfhydrase family protein [Bryobacteraceae bacterium]|nr:D-cysteine desulfhydrase family protein [Bryobacteraceae bacterium]
MMHPIDCARVIDRFEAIPRLALGHYPTPVEKMTRLRAAIGGGPKLFIKRDDYTGPGCGGNKVRKLEYVLAQAQAQGARAVITCGGVRSNHCRVTAMLAARLGLECVLVLNQPAIPYERKPASLAIDEMVGARIVVVDTREERAPAMESVAREMIAAEKHPAIIPLGASTPLGAMGFVSAAAELAAQMDAGGITFDTIFFSSSSGGTHAGLSVGKELFLTPKVQLYGVSPDDSAESIVHHVRGIIRGMGEQLSTEFDQDVTVLDEYSGPGYGLESEAGREALNLLARTEGILLDPVYTAKAMAGLIDWIRSGLLSAERNVLFWHTGGQMALFDG